MVDWVPALVVALEPRVAVSAVGVPETEPDGVFGRVREVGVRGVEEDEEHDEGLLDPALEADSPVCAVGCPAPEEGEIVPAGATVPWAFELQAAAGTVSEGSPGELEAPEDPPFGELLGEPAVTPP